MITDWLSITLPVVASTLLPRASAPLVSVGYSPLLKEPEMPRHDRAYGVWYQSGQKGGSKRKGTLRLFQGHKSAGAPVSKYAAKRDRKTEES
jgi:hypothetical protein